MEVKNLFTGDSYFIQERVKRDSVWLQMTSKEDKIRTCTYSKLSGFGHTIYGLECLPAVNLPSGCFCASSPSPTPYLPLTDLLALVAKKGVNRTQVSVETKDFSSWHVDADNIHLSATFINDLNHSLHGLTPFTLSLTHNGKDSRPEGPSFSKNTQFFREIVMFFRKCHSFLILKIWDEKTLHFLESTFLPCRWFKF